MIRVDSFSPTRYATLSDQILADTIKVMKSYAIQRWFLSLNSDVIAVMMRNWLLLFLGLFFSLQVHARESFPTRCRFGQSTAAGSADYLVNLIKQGGPFLYAKDGVVFGNYEGILPRQWCGYYHEFRVKTPRACNRGARCIIAGGTLPPQKKLLVIITILTIIVSISCAFRSDEDIEVGAASYR